MGKPRDPEGLDLLGFKKCNKCDRWILRSEYYKEKTKSNDRLGSYCKRCSKEYSTTWNKEHLEAHRKAVRKSTAKWRVTNPEYDREYRREYQKQPMPAWKSKIRQETRQLILQGYLLHPGCCEECGVVVGDEQIHIHHLTYLRPDKVLFLCPQCHQRWHNENPAPPEPSKEWAENWYETYQSYPKEGGIDGNLD